MIVILCFNKKWKTINESKWNFVDTLGERLLFTADGTVSKDVEIFSTSYFFSFIKPQLVPFVVESSNLCNQTWFGEISELCEKEKILDYRTEDIWMEVLRIMK